MSQEKSNDDNGPQGMASKINIPTGSRACDDNEPSEITMPDLRLDSFMANEEAAESSVLSSVENRASKTAGVDGFQAAVEGERPPLGTASLKHAFGGLKGGKPKKMLEAVNKVRTAQRLAKFQSMARADSSHKRAATLLESIAEDASDKSEADASMFHRDNMSNLDKLLDSSSRASGEAKETTSHSRMTGESVVSDISDHLANETLPLLSNQSSQGPSQDSMTFEERLKQIKAMRLRRNWQYVKQCFHPRTMFEKARSFFFNSTLVVSMPMFFVGWILFYYLGNPELDFLPGSATMSWWLHFIGRQLIVFEIVKFIQRVLIDYITISTRLVSNYFGPLVTIFFTQARGWPFIVAVWGLLDLVLLHGDNAFQQHWLFFTGIQVYSQANSGLYILASGWYLRFLFSMILAGSFTGVKRTLVTIYFGRRHLATYKPKLEAILKDIILVTEIAILAEAAGDMAGVSSVNPRQLVEESVRMRKAGVTQLDMNNFKYLPDNDTVNLSAGDQESVDSAGEEDEKEREDYYRSQRSSANDMEALLDSWDEPVNKLDKSSTASVEDIFRFRKALIFMDLNQPFSEAFGPASTRQECIASAQAVYSKLLNLSPGSTVLSFTVLKEVVIDDNGLLDYEKLKFLKRLFRPDVSNQLSLIEFIQSCDNIYKRLRYFRASIGNSSVIDKVLESIIDTFFGFVIGLLILTLLNFNPWPLLVSMSTLLVTFAFAVGPSAAKMIEGITLIAGRRPFEIGDRIVINNSAGGPINELECSDSWIVEDITLFSTTLRYAANNAVATLNNGSLASARITNLARSTKALITINLKLDIDIHSNQSLQLFREALDTYIEDHPRTWVGVACFRCEAIDADSAYVVYKLQVHSRHSWQNAGTILADRSELTRFCFALAEKLNVLFISGPQRRVLYAGGMLIDGAMCGPAAIEKKNLRNTDSVIAAVTGDEKVAKVLNANLGRGD